MRPLPTLLLALALLASAGCFSREESDADAPPVTTPAPTEETPTPTSPVASTPPATTTPPPSTPAPPARKVVYNGSHDFSGPPAPPGTPPRTENFTLNAGHAALEIRIVLTSTAGPAGDISLSAGATVRVLDPSGQAVAECAKKEDPGCSKDVPTPAAGSWKVEYAGSGTSKANVTITGA